MTVVSIPIVGPTYTNRSLPVNAQITRNFYIEINREGGEAVSLMPFPGLKSFATTGAGSNRGSGRFQGTYYTVTGNTLYSIDNLGTATSRGTIPGSNHCKLVSDGINLVITYGTGKPITWNGTTLTVGTDVDLPNANTSAYINRRVAYDGAGADIAFSDLDTPLSVNSANITKAQSAVSDTLAVESNIKQVIVFSEDIITPYYNSGSGNPPYDIIQNSLIRIGLGAIHSVATNKDFIYFLGSDLMVYRMGGLQAQAIGNPAIGQAIEGYANPKNAKGMVFTFQNQNFYLLSFDEESWLFSEGSGWTNLAFGVSGAPSLINSYQKIYEKHLVADRRNGNIYELDFDTFTHNGDVIQWQRDTVSVNGRTFGVPGARVFMNKLELVLEPGTSLITGQGSDAQIMMSYSDDNGQTFSSERWMSVGVQGEYKTKLEWFGLGWFYNRMFRFKMSDPIKWTLISLHADVDLSNG